MIPNSYGTELREFNPCHDPEDGRFTTRDRGNCGPAVAAPSGPQTRRVRQPPPLMDRARFMPTTLGQEAREAVSVIVRENPTGFDVPAALRAAGGRFQGTLAQMMRSAPEANAQLSRTVRRLGKKIGVEVEMGPIKSVTRIIDKAVHDYAGDLTQVRDVVRASLVADSMDDVYRVLKQTKRSLRVTREKDRFKDPLDSGYRDITLNVQLDNGLIGEIQIHLSSILRTKNTEGHRLYEQLRQAKYGTREYASLMAESKAIYDTAYLAGLRKKRQRAGQRRLFH